MFRVHLFCGGYPQGYLNQESVWLKFQIRLWEECEKSTMPAEDCIDRLHAFVDDLAQHGANSDDIASALLNAFVTTAKKGRQPLGALEAGADGGKPSPEAGPDYGFSSDRAVYGHSRGIQLPDGSIYIAYHGTGGHKWDDASHTFIYALRVRVRSHGRGIKPLSAPGSPNVATNG